MLVIGAFTGFEATAIYAEEARDPCRKVSRATFIAIGFLTVFHAAGCWLIMGAFGADRAVDLAGEAAGPTSRSAPPNCMSGPGSPTPCTACSP
ncbi:MULTISPECIES: hypothetical protein [unclassified Streptomyces]|uniref:hypothetical protein n=1 Tax=unclassified Streptomyces TaxID=2593676 RepID=UPI0029BC9C72|nr:MULTISPECIES: hypothetical protein [unclassified Streptomyces]MDX3768383.1 hypothetical protein [Streptomyces sp. AK08-01B]MDX3817714.1 hypothetical protein [Streptomyces sp. AK08-01A]